MARAPAARLGPAIGGNRRDAIGRGMMTYEEFNEFCKSLPAATYVVQWGGSHVWKVGAKVFAIGGWHGDEVGITFKVSDLSYAILKEQTGLRPAPYLASRGLKWIQHFAKPGLTDNELRRYLRQSYHLVVEGLSKKKRLELQLFEAQPEARDRS